MTALHSEMSLSTLTAQNKYQKASQSLLAHNFEMQHQAMKTINLEVSYPPEQQKIMHELYINTMLNSDILSFYNHKCVTNYQYFDKMHDICYCIVE